MNDRSAHRSDPSEWPGGSRHVPKLALFGLALVVAVGVLVAVIGGGDDSGADDGAAAFGTVTATGPSLPPYGDGIDDPAVGTVAPSLEGQDPQGREVEVGPGAPTLVAFLAHWCPHCQAELPRLVELERSGALAGVRLVAVLTGSNPSAPNFPPAPWLEREGWTGEVFLDDGGAGAAGAYGLAGYPFLVAIDAEGRVVGRTSGEQPASVIERMAEAARGGPD